MDTSPPFWKEGDFVTMFNIPPGATFPYNNAALPFNTSTFSNEETSGIDPLLKRNPFLNMLLADMSYPLEKNDS
ncbi:hypothetical protein D3C80_1020570 [compost metagenome]